MAMKKLARSAALAGLAMTIILSASAQGVEIKVPSLVVNGIRYNHVTLNVLSAQVVKLGTSSSTAANLPTTCSPYTNVTNANLARITNGMTLDQVNEVIGCQYTPPITHVELACLSVGGATPESCKEPVESYVWGVIPNIVVKISPTTGRVIGKSGGLLFP